VCIFVKKWRLLEQTTALAPVNESNLSCDIKQGKKKGGVTAISQNFSASAADAESS
jgi:hypothetical protein